MGTGTEPVDRAGQESEAEDLGREPEPSHRRHRPSIPPAATLRGRQSVRRGPDGLRPILTLRRVLDAFTAQQSVLRYKTLDFPRNVPKSVTLGVTLRSDCYAQSSTNTTRDGSCVTLHEFTRRTEVFGADARCDTFLGIFGQDVENRNDGIPRALGGGMIIYRAADDTDISAPCCFAEELETARAYLDAGQYGGSTLYRADVEISDVLDLTACSDELQAVCDLIGAPHPCATSACEYLMLQAVADRLAALGYRWVRVTEIHPAGAITLVCLVTGIDALELEDSLTEV